MFPFVAAAIRRLNEARLPVIVITNQSGVGRGYFPESLVHTVHQLMTRQFAAGGARVRRSFLVGDRYLDIDLAHRAGARGILVRTGYGEGELAWHAAQWARQPDFVAEDLAGATEWILGQTK